MRRLGISLLLVGLSGSFGPPGALAAPRPPAAARVNGTTPAPRKPAGKPVAKPVAAKPGVVKKPTADHAAADAKKPAGGKCSAEKTLLRPYLERSPGAKTLKETNVCQPEAAWHAQAAAMCEAGDSALGGVKVQAGGCKKGFGEALYTCCPPPAGSKPVSPPKKSALPERKTVRAAAVPRAPKIDAKQVPSNGKKPPPPTVKYVSPIFMKPLNTSGDTLRGYVDLHTHLMNHLGFGGKLLHGGTDPGVLMPTGSIYDPGPACATPNRHATSIEDALGTCYGTHGGLDLANNRCGSDLRHLALSVFTGNGHHDSHDVRDPQGYPGFKQWPRWNDVNHQQMYVDWVKRAYDGGLRVMVTLAGNSVTFATVLDGNRPFDDRSTADIELDEMAAFAARHGEFVEIAKSARDVRRIVGQDKLAMILGVELDHLGNFGNNGTGPTPDPSEADVRAEIHRLYDQKGVRYVFPIHLVDNPLGGTAVYENMFTFANFIQTGNVLSVGCAAPATGIGHRVNTDLSPLFAFLAIPGLHLQTMPNCDDPPQTFTVSENGVPVKVPVGYENNRALTPLGRVALDEIMKLGMIVDIDHTGQHTFDDIVEYTRNTVGGAYPLVAGHNAVREGRDGSERSLTHDAYAELAGRTSIVGVGSDSEDAGNWMEAAREIASQCSNNGQCMPIAFGSDTNGAANLPRPPYVNTSAFDPGFVAEGNACKGPTAPATADWPYTSVQCVQYVGAFKKEHTGSKDWDYNTEGVANFGLFPDFLKDVEGRDGRDVVAAMYQGAQGFTRMWEAAEAVASRLPHHAGAASSADRTAQQRSVGLRDLMTTYGACILDRYETPETAGLPVRDGGVTCVAGNACSSAQRTTAYNQLTTQAARGDEGNFGTLLGSAVLADCFQCPEHGTWHTRHVHCTSKCRGNGGFAGGCFETCKGPIHSDPHQIADDIARALK